MALLSDICFPCLSYYVLSPSQLRLDNNTFSCPIQLRASSSHLFPYQARHYHHYHQSSLQRFYDPDDDIPPPDPFTRRLTRVENYRTFQAFPFFLDRLLVGLPRTCLPPFPRTRRKSWPTGY